ASIRLDLAGDGKPTDKFIDILQKIMQRQQFDFLKSNPEFLVGFDRGDVAWLRAYCHLLMGMLDFYLAFDTKRLFDLSADELFEKPKKRSDRRHGDSWKKFPDGTWKKLPDPDVEKRQKVQNAWKEIAVKEPARLDRFSKQLSKE